MTATAHALVAAAIARAIPDPTLSLPLAFGSHFILDLIPHWDFGTSWRSRTKFQTGSIAIADTLMGFTVAYIFFAGKVSTPILFSAVVLGNIPDWFEAPWYIFFARHDKHEPKAGAGFWELLTYWIYRIENTFHTRAAFPFGLLTQAAVVAFFLILLGSM